MLLDKYIEQIHSANSEISKRKKLKDLCRTRWVERHDAFEAFWDLYEGIVSCFEEIIEAPAGNWNRDTITNAQLYLRAMTEFRLIITLIITKNLLAYTKGLSIKLQGKLQDIVRAYSNIQSTKLSLEDIRKNIDFHSRWYDEACTLANKINVQPSIPRINSRQTAQANTPMTSSKEYQKCVISIPVLDQLISEFNDRFDEYNSKALIALKLLPPSMYKLDDKDLRDFLDLYDDFYLKY